MKYEVYPSLSLDYQEDDGNCICKHDCKGESHLIFLSPFDGQIKFVNKLTTKDLEAYLWFKERNTVYYNKEKKVAFLKEFEKSMEERNQWIRSMYE